MEFPPSPTSPIDSPKEFTSEKKLELSSKIIVGEDELPKELLQDIFSFMSKEDFQNLSLVTKDWSQMIVVKVHREQSKSLQNLVKGIANCLDEKDVKHRDALAYCHSLLKKEVLGSASLLGIKKDLSTIKEELITMLKTLDETTLSAIDTFCKKNAVPLDFKNLGKLPALYKKLDQANKITDDETKKYNDLWNIAIALANEGAINKAVEITISKTGQYESNILESLANLCIDNKNFDKAQKIAKLVPAEGIQYSILNRILINKCEHDFQVEKYKSKETIEKALDVAMTSSYENSQAKLLATLSDWIAIYVSIDKALEVAKMIPEKSPISIETKSIALRNISFRIKDNDKALKVVLMIPDELLKIRTLPTIIEVLEKKEDIAKAQEFANKGLEIAKTIQDESTKSLAILYAEKFQQKINIAKMNIELTQD